MVFHNDEIVKTFPNDTKYLFLDFLQLCHTV